MLITCNKQSGNNDKSSRQKARGYLMPYIFKVSFHLFSLFLSRISRTAIMSSAITSEVAATSVVVPTTLIISFATL